MRIGIHGHGDRTMSQKFLYDFWMDTHGQQNGCCTVTQIMKSHMRETSLLKQDLEMPKKFINTYKITKVIREHQIQSFPVVASFCFHLVLIDTMIFQRFQGNIGKHNFPSTRTSFWIM